MAKIRSLTRVSTHAGVHPTDVDATWAIVPGPSGNLLQISTFGSDSRQSRPKVSQTIQLDEHVARQLMDAFAAAFGT